MKLNDKTVAVTGASGMLGVYICRSLLAKGANVIGVVRNPDKAKFLADEGVTFRQADLTDKASLEAAFEGVDAVVSNAAMFVASKSMGAYEAHRDANVTGTTNVYEAAITAKVKRVIHVSTFGIYRFRLGTPMDESTKQLNGAKKQGGPYRATKQISEKLAWEISQRGNIDLTVVRPTGVYGARDWNLLQPLYKLLQWPLMIAPGLSFPLVYAGDVADAIAAALTNDKSIGEAYNTGGDDKTFGSFMRAVRAGMAKGATLIPLPLPLAVRVDNSKAERDLGFNNRSFDEALKQIWAQEAPPTGLALTSD